MACVMGQGAIQALCDLAWNLDGLSSDHLRKLVVMLLGKVSPLEQLVAEQRTEIARLKGPPDIRPSVMDTVIEPAKPDRQENRPRRGQALPRVSIEERRVLKAAAPAGSRFKGYETYLVQDLVLSARAIRYKRERWVTSDGRTIVAPLTAGTKGHFGPDLRRFCIDAVSSRLDHLAPLDGAAESVGVSISKRGIQRLLTKKHDGFLDEARDVLCAGLQTSPRTRSTIPVRGIKPGTAFARRSATTTLPNPNYG